ncbi:MAG: MBL fold metallo-hydrolase [Candidatus Bathyarchaeota archaeon]
MKITENIYSYPGSERVDFITSNTYLIKDETVTIVDPGHPENLGKLVNQLEEDEINLKSISLIVNTHGHFDHCGANNALKKISNAKIAIHQLEEEYLFSSLDEMSKIFGKKMQKFKADFYLGDYLKTGNMNFQVIHTPGHTPGGVCLYEKERKILLSGDTVFPHGNIGRTDLPGGEINKLISSIRRLCNLDVRVLCPGHMSVITEGANTQVKESSRLAESMVESA